MHPQTNKCKCYEAKKSSLRQSCHLFLAGPAASRRPFIPLHDEESSTSWLFQHHHNTWWMCCVIPGYVCAFVLHLTMWTTLTKKKMIVIAGRRYALRIAGLYCAMIIWLTLRNGEDYFLQPALLVEIGLLLIPPITDVCSAAEVVSLCFKEPLPGWLEVFTRTYFSVYDITLCGSACLQNNRLSTMLGRTGSKPLFLCSCRLGGMKLWVPPSWWRWHRIEHTDMIKHRLPPWM